MPVRLRPSTPLRSAQDDKLRLEHVLDEIATVEFLEVF
jgi:hypothetical protein